MLPAQVDERRAHKHLRTCETGMVPAYTPPGANRDELQKDDSSRFLKSDFTLTSPDLRIRPRTISSLTPRLKSRACARLVVVKAHQGSVETHESRGSDPSAFELGDLLQVRRVGYAYGLSENTRRRNQTVSHGHVFAIAESDHMLQLCSTNSY